MPAAVLIFLSWFVNSAADGGLSSNELGVVRVFGHSRKIGSLPCLHVLQREKRPPMHAKIVTLNICCNRVILVIVIA